MDKRKNQHFVPQFLLRGCADEDDRVHTFHIENQKEYPKTSVSNICSDDYFYGDSEIEKSLDPLEDRHSDIIQDLRDEKSVAYLSDDDIRFFAVFVLFQRNRMKQAKEQVVEHVDNMAKEVIRAKIESGEVENREFGGKTVLELLDRITIKEENPLARLMLRSLTGIGQIMDLEVALIHNTTGKEFVISGHPVVHDNRRFKDERDRHLIGIQSRGLQMFIPLSDDVLVMLYDPKAYFVDYTDKAARRVKIDSETIVDSLNNLQLINAFEAVYYRNPGREDEFNEACEQLSDDIDADNIKFQRLDPDEHQFDTENEVVASGQLSHDYSPILPFVKQRQGVEFEIRRNPEAAREHRELTDEIMDSAREQQE